MIEKPFGYDLASARDAQRAACCDVFHESQVFRIDHYLGKETVQNLMALPVRQRVVRAGLEPQLHRLRPDHRRRGHRHREPRRLLRPCRRAARPDPEPHAAAAGAADDGAADRRSRPTACATRRSRCSRRSCRRRSRRSRRWRCARSTARGRWAANARPRLPRGGRRGRQTRAPRPTPRCACTCSNWRWAGVPFYLRTGKRLARKVTEIAVTLKPVPHLAFQSRGSLGVQPEPAHPHRAARRGRVGLARGQDPRRR